MTIFLQESLEKNNIKAFFKGFSKIDNNIQIPFNSKTKLTYKKVKKIIKYLKKNNIKQVVLSKFLDKSTILKNDMLKNKINIIDGKILYKYLLGEIIEFICNETNLNKDKLEMAILIDNIKNINKQELIDLSSKIKRINIISNNIDQFKKLEDFLYSEYGFVINISNNKKAIINSKIIINLDFNENMINKYRIPANSIIIDINNNIKIRKKSFNGIIINDYNIIMPSEYKKSGFEDKYVYEKLVINNHSKSIKKQIIKDKIKIKNLIGEKGTIKFNLYIDKI